MTLLPLSESTGYAAVDEALARHFYLMKVMPSNDDIFGILYDLDLLTENWITDENRTTFRRIARNAIKEKAMSDVRTLVRYIRLKQKGILT